MHRSMPGRLIVSAVASVLVAALGALPAAAGAKPKGPEPREMVAAQLGFSAVADSDEFLLALRNWDWDSAKVLMNGVGVSPNPDFPQEVPKCVPPAFLVVTLQWGYGPNPPPDGPSQWHAVWIPQCLKIKPYVIDHAISLE